MHWYKIICSSSQIVQNHNIISHYYFVHSFKVEDVLRFRQFESQTTFNKSKVVDDVPQLIKLHENVFLILFQNVSATTILTYQLSWFQKRCILDYQKFHTLEIWKSFHRREYVSVIVPECWNVEKNKFPP